MKIREVFAKPIDRNIKGVIAIGDEQDTNIKQELEEYVVTQELQKHFHDFFEAYVASINHDTTNMGVWISGFFGSGKSHFLKILAYLLENHEVVGKPALDYFLDEQKILDPGTIKNMQLATSIHNETILFNIDSKAKDGNKAQKDAILNVFLQVFNEHLGLSTVDFWIADLERNLIKNKRYKDFQDKFKELDTQHRTWLEARNGFAFLKGTIKDALVGIDYMSAENAAGFIDQLKMPYPISVENFAQLVNEYIQEKDDCYHLVFLVDEIGQYVGDSQQRMLNLQSIVEDLGTYTHGKAWVIVTSQQAIDQVTDNINGQDFSKIQGRFHTRIAMSSANVDEVIKKRLLMKTPVSEQVLASLYDNDQHAIKNLITFEADIERDHYRNPQNFADVYPFVPYQFNLLQDTLTAIRENGSDGKHLANGERSMLAIFQESAQLIEDQNTGALVPFSTFFKGLEQFLDHTHEIVIRRAISNDVVNPEGEAEPFTVKVLQTLFMVKYVNNFNATLNNIVTLMIDSVTTDRIKLEQKVTEALNILSSQKLIEKTTRGYEFLTDAEQDISRQIGKQNVESSEVAQAIGEYVFNNLISKKFVYPKLHKQYTFTFNQFVDDQPIGATSNEMGLRINTADSDSNREEMELHRLAISESNPQIIIDMPAGGQYTTDLRQALRIEKFVLDTSSQSTDERAAQIIGVKRSERKTLLEKAHVELENALESADIYVSNECLSAGTKGFKQRLENAQIMMVDTIYRNLNFMTGINDEKSILELFKNKDQNLVDTDENSQALKAVLGRINYDYSGQSKISYKSILDRFSKAPYGYREIDIKWLIAKLFIDAKLKVYVNGEQININSPKTANEFAENLIKKRYVDKMQFVPREAISARKKADLKEVAADVFNKRSFTDDKDETYVVELRDHNIQNTKQLLNQYLAQSERYPGRNILEDGQRLLDKLLNCLDTDNFYNMISEKKDDLLDWHDDMEDDGLFDFYQSAEQQKIWNNALDKVDIYDHSETYISDSEVKTLYDEIKQIIKGNKPYGQLNKLKELNEAFNTAYSTEFDRDEKVVRDEIDAERKSVKDYAQDQGLSDTYGRTVDAAFEHLVGQIELSKDLDSLFGIKPKIEAIKNRLMTSIDSIIAEKEQKELQEKARQEAATSTKDQENIGQPSTPLKATPVVKHLSLNSLPISKTWQLNSAEDVDAELAQLRQVLLAQLNDADRIKLDL